MSVQLEHFRIIIQNIKACACIKNIGLPLRKNVAAQTVYTKSNIKLIFRILPGRNVSSVVHRPSSSLLLIFCVRKVQQQNKQPNQDAIEYKHDEE